MNASCSSLAELPLAYSLVDKLVAFLHQLHCKTRNVYLEFYQAVVKGFAFTVQGDEFIWRDAEQRGNLIVKCTREFTCKFRLT